jgi:hypothetical protein
VHTDEDLREFLAEDSLRELLEVAARRLDAAQQEKEEEEGRVEVEGQQELEQDAVQRAADAMNDRED